jgi:hypothetical protein
LKDELVEALMKEGNDGNDRTALNDNIEQITLMPQPMFGYQQVPRRRNGNELGDSFDDPKYDGNNPVRHPWDKREIDGEDKKKDVKRAAGKT